MNLPHVGRSWSGAPLEDACPCPQEPCGLVVLGRAHPACAEHNGRKTIRQSHRAQDCPGSEQTRAALTAAAQRNARRLIDRSR